MESQVLGYTYTVTYTVYRRWEVIYKSLDSNNTYHFIPFILRLLLFYIHYYFLKLSTDYLKIIPFSHVYYTCIIRVLYEYYTSIIRVLYEYYTSIIRVLYVYYTYIIHSIILVLYLYYTYILKIKLFSQRLLNSVIRRHSDKKPRS